MLSWKKSRKFYAERLEISEQEVDNLLEELKKQPKQSELGKDAEVANYIHTLEEKVVEVNEEKGTLKSSIELDYEPKTTKELAKLHKIDLDKYKISSYWSKLKSSGKFTSSVFATLKKPKDYSPEDFANFLKNYNPPKLTILKVDRKQENYFREVDVELSISDFHLGKKTLEGESLVTKKVQYMHVLSSLIAKVSNSFKINKIVFPIGNDFFHTDNYQNSTTNGTPQDVLVGYNKEYEEGFDLLVHAISYLKEFANSVEVVLIQGNHDRTKCFYLAHALEVFFKNTPNIKFQRHHSTTKHVVLGNTFIGYHHGNCKIDELPLLFATGESSKDFGNALYKEVHTGDKHHYMAKEIKGVRIQQLPSLSGTDRWHLDNNYINNIRAGIVMIYDPILGKVGEFESRI
jgi:hypothetical protein